MANNLKETQSNTPDFITKQELDLIKIRFEREVIDPMFFGHVGRGGIETVTGEETARVQRAIDITSNIFYGALAENFEVSNKG